MLADTQLDPGLRDGFGLHLDSIRWLSRAEAISRSRRAVYLLEAFQALSVGSSKVSILGLYWRLFSMTNLRCAIMYLSCLSLWWLAARVSRLTP